MCGVSKFYLINYVNIYKIYVIYWANILQINQSMVI